MIWWLALLFTVVPLVETFVLIEVGTVIGPLPTVLMLLVSGLVGAWLAKREGIGILRKAAADLNEGIPPATTLVEGVLVLVGAVLLVTPGFTTDLVGMVFLFPPTRRFLAPYVLKWFLARFKLEGVQFGIPKPSGTGGRPPSRPTPESERRGTPFDHPVR